MPAQTGVRRHDARRNFLIAGSVVQTAPQRPRRIARHGVVELNAVHIHVLILRIVTADVETHFAELVGRDVIEEVFRSRERRGQSLRVVGGFGVELREDRVVDHLTLRIGHEDHRIDVAHLRTDTYGRYSKSRIREFRTAANIRPQEYFRKRSYPAHPKPLSYRPASS